MVFLRGWARRASAPVGIALIEGLITSTLLTLIVVPMVYTVIDDITHHLRKKPNA